MGAQESRSQPEADDDGTTLQDDYYTILEVDENATADEIRVSSFSPLQQECDHVVFFFFLFFSPFLSFPSVGLRGGFFFHPASVMDSNDDDLFIVALPSSPPPPRACVSLMKK